MTSATSRSDLVTVIDLRGWHDTQPPDVEGRVVVVDEVDDILGHEHLYRALTDNALKVHRLLLVAVGRPVRDAERSGTVIVTPHQLPTNIGGILWVGDENGVRWSPAHALAERATPATPTGLDRLLEALRLPEVFDEVVKATGGFPDRAASPGHLLVSGAVDPDALRTATRAVVRQVVDARSQPQSMPRALAEPTRFAAEQSEPGAVLVGRAKAREDEVSDALAEAEEGASRIVGLGGLFGRDRPGRGLAATVERAGRAADAYRQILVEMTRRIDTHLRVGEPTVEDVTMLGIRPPTEPRHGEIAARVEETVRSATAARVPLITLAEILHHASALAAPQGCAAEREELAGRPEIVRQVGPFRYFPLWLWSILLIVVTAFLAAFVPPVTWGGAVAGSVVVVAWFAAGWFLLARRPLLDDEQGFSDTAVPAVGAYLVPGLVGGGVGLWLAIEVRERLLGLGWIVPDRWVVIVLVACAVLLALTVGLAWPTAARRWVARFRLDELRAEFSSMRAVAERAIVTEWLPSERRRAVSEAFAETATALDEIALKITALSPEAPAGGDPRRDGMMSPLRTELQDVVRDDVLALVHASLTPAWSVITDDRRSPQGVYEQRSGRLVAEYEAHVAHEGLLTLPPCTTDPESRDRLVARQWSETPQAAEAMRAQSSDTMAQLCRHEDLAVIDQQSRDSVLRFAPKPVERVMKADRGRHRNALAGRPIWTVSGSLTGVLRLMPLRWGSIDSTPAVTRGAVRER